MSVCLHINVRVILYFAKTQACKQCATAVLLEPLGYVVSLRSSPVKIQFKKLLRQLNAE